MRDFKCILYRELSSLKYKLRNFILSIVAALVFPILILIRKPNYMSANIFASVCTIIVPLMITIQFITASMGEEKKDNTLCLLLNYDMKKWELMLGKTIIPIILANIFSIISILEFKFIVSTIIDVNVDLLVVLGISLISTLYGAVVSFLIAFIVKSEVYYQTVSVLASCVIFGVTLYLTNPIKNGSLIFTLISLVEVLGIGILSGLIIHTATKNNIQ